MKRPSKWLARVLALSMLWAQAPSQAEDIDIFTGGSVAASNPSILFVLDNTSNWARQSQQWPGGVQQGQSEANAIKTLINDASVINSGVNLGLFEFVTEGNANNNGGFVRFPISSMTDANKAALSAKLTSIYSGVNDPTEKRNSNTPYGNLLYDVYNYLAGGHTYDTLNPPNPDAAASGYTTPYSVFKSPITPDNGCGRIFMVFIGNPNSSGPADDSTANTTTLGGLSCDTTNIPLPVFSSSTTTQLAALGSGVYASQAACEAAAATTYGAQYSGYTCVLASSATTQTTLATTSCGQYTSQAACQAAAATTYGSLYPSYSCEVASACTGNISLGTSACGQYGSVAACQAGMAAEFPGYGAYSCSESASACGGGATTLRTTTCGQYATAAACRTAAAAAYPGYESYSCTSAGSCTSGDLDGAACYKDQASCQTSVLAANPGYNSVSCGSGSTTGCATGTYVTCGGASDYNSGATCTALGNAQLPGYPTYGCVATNDNAVCPAGGAKKWTVTGSGKQKFTAAGTGTTWTMTGTQATTGTRYDMVGIDGGSTYTVKGNSTSNTYNIFGQYTATSFVPTGSYGTASNKWNADEWARCLNQRDLSADGTAARTEVFKADFTTSGTIVGADTITFDGVTTLLSGGETPAQIAEKVAAQTYANWTTFRDPSDPVKDKIVGFTRVTTGDVADVTASDFSIVDDGDTGTKPAVVVTVTTQGAAATGGASGRQNVTTYTIDVFNAQPDASHTGLMMSMAQQGGGRYFSAKNEAQILSALKQIVSEIQSVNTAFAAASIPLSTTNRSQNLNEVYIGVFRPSLEPRWFGNLKKFRISTANGVLDLVDSAGATALNSQTGFLNDCGTSFWTTDSGAWWDGVKNGALDLVSSTLINPVPKSTCVAMPADNTSPWSDLPDGQSVEKGAVASVIRRGNNPPTTATTPTWQVNRTLYTRSGNSLAALTDAAVGGNTNLYNYIRGVDINVSGSHVTEKTLATPITDAVRPSVHGDVVHSRPLAVNFGVNDTTIFYGANDGMLRAVDGATGKEKWAFIPAEFLDTSKQTRLMQNTPTIAYGATPAVGSTPKNYMFDGSPGLYQSIGNTKVWIYPTQRRGGRMVHALDVTNAVPALKWYQGCPNLGDDTGCTTGFSGIGQTWSVPVVTKIKGYHATKPVVVFGGGYDDCEDVRPATSPPTWACSSAKGRAIYVVDAEDGTLLKTFTITGMRGVTAGVSFVDVNNDGYSDYGYVADLGGTIYRLSFITSPSDTTPLVANDWSMKKVAYTDGSRKFMFTPAVTFGGGSTVYVALGSGDRERPLAEDYPYVQTIQNYVYGYRDELDAYNAATTACNMDGNAAVDGSCSLDYTAAPAACDSPGILPTGSPAKQSWRVGLVYRGEQTVTQAIILGGMVSLNTTRPVPAGVCSAALGEGGGYFLNLINGSGAIGVSGNCGGSIRGSFVGVGLPTDPVVVNLPGEDPICIGCVDRTNTNPSIGSKLFQPTEVAPPISKRKFRKYRYQSVD